MQASQSSTNGETSEAGLGDRAVDDPLLTEAVQKALGDLVAVALSV